MSDIVFEDRSGPLPPAPKRAWWDIATKSPEPGQRIKIITKDEDTGESTSENMVIPLVGKEEIISKVCEAAKCFGRTVTKIVVTEKDWVDIGELNTFGKASIGLGFLGWLAEQ